MLLYPFINYEALGMHMDYQLMLWDMWKFEKFLNDEDTIIEKVNNIRHL